MDNKNWYDLLPLYIEGQLSPSEVYEIEQKLARDPSLRAAYIEWQTVAEAVRDEAAYWATKLPPLSAKVKAQLHVSQATQPNLAPPIEPTRLTQLPTRQLPKPQTNDGFEPTQLGLGYHEPRYQQTTTLKIRRFPFSAAAAALILLFVGVFLIYNVIGTSDPEQPSSASLSNKQPTTPTITPFFANDATAFPTNTPSSADVPTRTARPPATNEPANFDTDMQIFESNPGLGGGGGNSTTGISSSPIAPPVDANAQCRASAPTDIPVTIYATPFGVPIARQMFLGDLWDVVAKTQANWYYVVSLFEPYDRGWVYGFEVALTGDCSVVPEPSPTPAQTQSMTVQCSAISVAGGTPFNVRSGPGSNYAITNTFFNAEANAYSDNGWVRIVAAEVAGGTIVYGWVRRVDVNLNGDSCDVLPTLSTQTITPESTTSPN